MYPCGRSNEIISTGNKTINFSDQEGLYLIVFESRLSIFWGQLVPTPEVIHGISREKFHSVNAVKGVCSLLTDLLLHKQSKIFGLEKK